MKRSDDRILTTHVGSLVRPPEIVDVLRRKADGQAFTESERGLVAAHVAEAVRRQAECGIDVPSDGEYGKTGFAQYITDRLTGFELRTDLPGRGGGTARSRDRKRFPEAYREIEGSAQNAATSTGQPQVQMVHTVCTGPITYRGHAAVQADIAHFKAALAAHRFEEAFIPAVAPGTIELQRAQPLLRDGGGVPLRDRRRDEDRVPPHRRGRLRAPDRRPAHGDGVRLDGSAADAAKSIAASRR